VVFVGARVQLTQNYTIHLVKVDDKAYMVSSDVSAFFWREDLIRSKVRLQDLIHSKRGTSVESMPQSDI
jgi:hypothetical protein